MIFYVRLFNKRKKVRETRYCGKMVEQGNKRKRQPTKKGGQQKEQHASEVKKGKTNVQQHQKTQQQQQQQHQQQQQQQQTQKQKQNTQVQHFSHAKQSKSFYKLPSEIDVTQVVRADKPLCFKMHYYENRNTDEVFPMMYRLDEDNMRIWRDYKPTSSFPYITMRGVVVKNTDTLQTLFQADEKDGRYYNPQFCYIPFIVQKKYYSMLMKMNEMVDEVANLVEAYMNYKYGPEEFRRAPKKYGLHVKADHNDDDDDDAEEDEDNDDHDDDDGNDEDDDFDKVISQYTQDTHVNTTKHADVPGEPEATVGGDGVRYKVHSKYQFPTLKFESGDMTLFCDEKKDQSGDFQSISTYPSFKKESGMDTHFIDSFINESDEYLYDIVMEIRAPYLREVQSTDSYKEYQLGLPYKMHCIQRTQYNPSLVKAIKNGRSGGRNANGDSGQKNNDDDDQELNLDPEKKKKFIKNML
jgi:hypothetical protein